MDNLLVGRRSRNRAVTLGLLGLAPALLVLAGCSPQAEPEAVSTPSSSVVQPGRPGEAAQTIAPEDFTSAPSTAPHNGADVEFMSDMIAHHDQAVVMSRWAPDQAASEQVRKFADRIEVAQRSEIDVMSQWLQERDQPVPRTAEQGDGSGPRAPEAHEHDPAAMPGMLTDQELAELEASDGAEFDRLFLEFMIRHHEGAITMCEDVLAHGTEEYVKELANTISVDQTLEIARMEQLLDAM